METKKSKTDCKINILTKNKRIGPTISVTEELYETISLLPLRYKTCQFMLGNKLSHYIRKIKNKDAELTKEFMIKNNKTCYVHSPYVNNLAGEHRLDKTLPSIISMMNEVSKLPCAAVYHFGAVGNVYDIIDTLNNVDVPVCEYSNIKYHLLLENSAGDGTKLGKNYDEIRLVFEGLDQKNRIGLCIDTCHAFGAGMCDFKDHESVVKLFDDLGQIDMIHLNDSLEPFGSCKDRHAQIGCGYIWNENKESLKTLVDICK